MVKETKVKRMRKRERMGEGAGRGRRERVIWSENERRERPGQIKWLLGEHVSRSYVISYFTLDPTALICVYPIIEGQKCPKPNN